MRSRHRAIGLKWVFKLNCNEEGEVVKHTHLVAKSYVWKQGVEFEEVFAPVARLESVCLLLAIAAHYSWEVHHMDVKSAFLDGELMETVYVRQPPSFLDNDNPNKVLRTPMEARLQLRKDDTTMAVDAMSHPRILTHRNYKE